MSTRAWGDGWTKHAFVGNFTILTCSYLYFLSVGHVITLLHPIFGCSHSNWNIFLMAFSEKWKRLTCLKFQWSNYLFLDIVLGCIQHQLCAVAHGLLQLLSVIFDPCLWCHACHIQQDKTLFNILLELLRSHTNLLAYEFCWSW